MRHFLITGIQKNKPKFFMQILTKEYQKHSKELPLQDTWLIEMLNKKKRKNKSTLKLCTLTSGRLFLRRF